MIRYLDQLSSESRECSLVGQLEGFKKPESRNPTLKRAAYCFRARWQRGLRSVSE